MKRCRPVSVWGMIVLGAASTLFAPPALLADTPVQEAEQADTADAAEKYRLEYRFSPSQFLHYVVRHHTTIDTQFGEAQLTTFNETVSRKHFRVVSVDTDGTAQLESVIDRVEMTARSGESKTVRFDSQAGPENCPREFRHVLTTIGTPLAWVEFTRSGKLVSIKPLHPTLQNAGQRAMDDQSLNFLMPLPEEPVAIGESWHDDIDVPVTVGTNLRKPVTLRRTYTLSSIEGTQAIIKTRVSVLTPVKDHAILAQLIQRTPSGQTTFDMSRGLVISRESTIDKMELEPFGPKSSLRVVSNRKETLQDAADIASSDESIKR